jgi:hypothetical protein
MIRLARAVLVIAVAALGACGKSPCQELGERICRCQPGLSTQACQTEVDQQLKSSNPGDTFCDQKLDSCKSPQDSIDLCEYLLTADGKRACGLTPDSP